MPTAQYIHNGITSTFNIVTPKSITSIWHWYKACFKSCNRVPIIPKGAISNEDGWMIAHSEASVKWIKFDLLNKDDRKAYIVILR